MTILFTICGRAGSKGFKNKNLKNMNGVPLIYYSLATIYGYASRHTKDSVLVALNTDSVPLVDLMNCQSVIDYYYIKRKEELAGDAVPKVKVIQDTYLEMKEYNPDLVIDLDITSPYRRISDIEDIIQAYRANSFDIVFSVVESRRSPYFNMVERKEDGYYRKVCQSMFSSRQQTPNSYELNASIYVYNPVFLSGEINKTILDYNCGIYVMPDYLVLDIDSEKDFDMMQYLHSYYCERDEGLKEVYTTAMQLYNSKR